MSIRIGIGLDNFASAGIDANAQNIYNRIIADGGVSNLTRLNFFVKGLKAIYGDLANVPVCYDAHWIGYKLGSGTGATAGQAAAKLYSLTVAGDAVQSTAASQPLLLAHNGASSDNYWWQVPSLPTNNCQTPYQASYNLTSYCDIRIKVDLNINATGQPDYPFLFGWNNFNGLGINSNGTLFFFLNGGGAATTTATISRTYSGWLRVVKNVGVYTYYTSTDGIDWTILQTLNASTANLSVANQPLIVGSSNNDARSCAMVKYYRCQLYSSTTLLADFNPAQYNASTSQNAWTSATGEVWSINTGTATTGYKGVLVDRTIMQGDGVDDVMDAAISGSGRYTQYLVTFPYGSITGNEAIAGPWNSSSWRGAIYTNSSKYATYQGAGSDGVFGSVITKGKLIQVGFVNSNTGTDWQPFVNGADVSNGGLNIGSQNAYTSINLFARSGGVTFSNTRINTYILTSQADTGTQRTSMYNIIRQLNNNAF